LLSGRRLDQEIIILCEDDALMHQCTIGQYRISELIGTVLVWGEYVHTTLSECDRDRAWNVLIHGQLQRHQGVRAAFSRPIAAD